MNLRCFCSFWILLAGLSSLACVPPEADYWKNRRKAPRPLPRVQVAQMWDHAVTLCPESLSEADNDGIFLHGAERSVRMDPSGTSGPAPDAAPTTADPAQDEIIRQVLEHHYGEPVQPTAAGLWRQLAIVAVPERLRVHAIHLRKKRVAWTLRTASSMVAPPQVYRSRVILQSFDNYVYCLFPDNGHEVWRAHASHRLTRSVAFWNDRVLVIPETSGTLQLFDLYDGSDVGKWSLPHPDDYFTAPPLMVGDTAVAAHAMVGNPSCRLVGLALSEQSTALGSAPPPTSVGETNH
jgi:hypothetical protein